MSNHTDTDFSLERLYDDLQSQLRKFGGPRRDRTGMPLGDRTDGLAVLLHTPDAGPVEVTDYPTAQGHKEYVGHRADALGMERILYQGSAILSLSCGGEFSRLAAGEASGDWYFLGRPSDIRPASGVDTVYRSALRQLGPDAPRPRDDLAVTFNMEGVVLEPAQNLCLRGLRAGLDMLTK